MSAQKGRDMLVKYKQADGSYRTLAGLRSKALRFNARTVDVTDSESANGWKELLPQAGVKFAEISGTGIFKDDDSAAIARQGFFDQSLMDLQFILPGFGVVEGSFLINALTYSGRYEGEAGLDISFMSAGEPAFNAL